MRIDDLETGKVLGPSDWILIDQDRIDRFGEATEDRQWIHVDPPKAAKGPFGGTIAHGYLTLGLVAPVCFSLLPVEARMTINYGLEKVRFPSPVPAGSRVRGCLEIAKLRTIEGGVQATINATIEREGGSKPACAAELVFRFYS